MRKFGTDSEGRSTIVYRGTRLGPEELTLIQSIVDSDSPRGLLGVAEFICQRFGWLRPNGEPPGISCSLFLRQLEKHDLLRLPPRPVKRHRRHFDSDRTAILDFLGTVPGMVECQPSGSLLVRPIAPEEYDGVRLHLQRYHYLGFAKPAGESLCYAAFLGNELVALLVWGSAVPHSSHRDQLIGWDAPTRRLRLPYVVNNARFLVLPWVRQPHLASRILGANLRRLSRDWQQAYGHPVFLAETFVDLARFKGTCYRASNWRHLGLTRGYSRSRHVPTGFFPNHRPKGVFVYPLHRRALPLLRGEVALRAEASPC